MSKEDRLKTLEARFSAMMASDDVAQITLKNALLEVMMRDGSADWRRVEASLVDQLAKSAGPTKLRLAAAIGRLREFEAKRR